jgi:hypothetical protein
MHTAERSTHDPSKMEELPEILLHAACDDLLLSVIQLLLPPGGPLHYCHSKGPNPVSTAALPWDIGPR